MLQRKNIVFFAFFYLFEAHNYDIKSLQCVNLRIQIRRKSQFSWKKTYIASKFELKPLQRFRFWSEKFKNCDNLRKNWIKQSTSWLMLHRANDLICIFRASLRSMIFNCEFYDASGFERNIFERVRIWKMFAITKPR